MTDYRSEAHLTNNSTDAHPGIPLDRRSMLAGLSVIGALPGAAWGATMPDSILASHVLRTDRHTTHYLETGPADGLLLIFLHGWPELSLIWRAQMEAFAAAGWRCIAPDMRGYGGCR